MCSAVTPDTGTTPQTRTFKQMHKLASEKYDKGEYEEAKRIMDELIEKCPHNHRYHCLYALILESGLRIMDKAEIHLQKAIKLLPLQSTNSRAHYLSTFGMLLKFKLSLPSLSLSLPSPFCIESKENLREQLKTYCNL